MGGAPEPPCGAAAPSRMIVSVLYFRGLGPGRLDRQGSRGRAHGSLAAWSSEKRDMANSARSAARGSFMPADLTAVLWTAGGPVRRADRGRWARLVSGRDRALVLSFDRSVLEPRGRRTAPRNLLGLPGALPPTCCSRPWAFPAALLRAGAAAVGLAHRRWRQPRAVLAAPDPPADRHRRRGDRALGRDAARRLAAALRARRRHRQPFAHERQDRPRQGRRSRSAPTSSAWSPPSSCWSR